LAGSGARHFARMDTTAGETAFGKRVGESGRVRVDSIPVSTSPGAAIGSSNGNLPASISASTRPRAYTSDRTENSPRLACMAASCSGAMYRRVPASPPVGGSFASAARLKSSSIGRPSSVSSTFAGLTSRCRIPRSWAWASPPANSAPSRSTQRTSSDDCGADGTTAGGGTAAGVAGGSPEAGAVCPVPCSVLARRTGPAGEQLHPRGRPAHRRADRRRAHVPGLPGHRPRPGVCGRGEAGVPAGVCGAGAGGGAGLPHYISL
jgi:hypothetical protein